MLGGLRQRGVHSRSRVGRLTLMIAVALATTATTANANHDFFGRATAGEVNGNGDNITVFRGLSGDGSRVFFETNEQLVANDTDIFVDIYERAGGKTTRISTGNGSTTGNGNFNSFFEDASADGARVVFATTERLVGTDTDDEFDLYQRDGTTTNLVSEGEVNGNGAFPASFMRASIDGKKVFFGTSEQLVGSDTDAQFDLYERSGGVTRRVSVGEVNGNGAFPAILRGSSDDGSRVFFDTAERLVPGDTDNAIDAYERSGGTTKRVTAGAPGTGNGPFDTSFRGANASGTRAFFETNEQLIPGDTDGAQDLYERTSGTTRLVSAGQINGNGPIDAFFASTSADGTRVFFQSNEQLTADDTDVNFDIYERSGGTTTRISAGQVNGNGNFSAFFVRASNDGSRVLFFTNEQLVAADTDGAQDLYERAGGQTALVSAGQINGNGPFPISSFGGASQDLSRVFFSTAEQLVPDDIDTFEDVYERVGGTTRLISPGGFTNASAASPMAVSDDGSRAFFRTQEPVIQGDTDTNFDIYGAYTSPGDGPAGVPHDLFQRVTAGEINGNGPFSGSFVGASDDGSRVIFITPEQLTGDDVDNSNDLYERSGGTTKRVSAGQVNGNGAFGVNFSGTSSDGSRVFFNTSEQLVADDTDNSLDVYQRFNNATTRISAGAVAGNGNFGAFFERASQDGSRVFFTTDEQLVAGDTDAATDVYERSSNATKLISAGAINGNGAFPVSFQGASDDGSRIFFRTDEQLAPSDTDSSPDIYERAAGVTTHVSVGGNKSFNVFFEGVSADGTRAFFETQEQLVASDTDTFFDVYERSGGTTKRVSVGAINGNGPTGAHFDGASDDGSQVFFDTREQLAATDTDNAKDIYRRAGGATSLVSAGQINGNGGFGSNFSKSSDDGSRVFFQTEEKLVTADTDGESDIYERSGGLTKLISAGEVNGNGPITAVFANVSADGSRVFFQTSEQLAPEDTDANNDVYERAAGTTRLITPGDLFAIFSGSSEDGSAVFFTTSGPVIGSDVDGTSDAYGAYVAP